MAKDYAKMVAILYRIKPYNNFIAACVARRKIPTSIEAAHGSRATNVCQSVMKKAMELTGLPGGVVREPLENLMDAEVRDLREALIQCDIPVVR